MTLETRGSKKIDPNSLPPNEKQALIEHRKAVNLNRREKFSIFRKRRRGRIKR